MLPRRPARGHSRSLALGPLALLLAAAASVTASVTASVAASPQLSPHEADALPIEMTEQEWANRHLIGIGHRATSPATGPIRQCAEWEPVTGALVRYPFGLPYDLLAEISEDIGLWVYVSSQSQQNTASSALQSNGATMANVHFIQTGTNSIWTRDYGPQFIFDGGDDAGIVDHIYNRPRPLDDATNYEAGDAWTTPVYGSSVIHTGGNYMCDGHGNGYSTDLVYDENPSLTPSGVDQEMFAYLGIGDYRVVDDISIGGIHHIDVWAKLLDEERILVKQVPMSNADYARCEARAAAYAAMTNAYGEPLQVERIFCASVGGGQVAGYTNAVILNNKVLVPTFGIAQDAIALQTYEDLMPGYEILGYDGSWLPDDAIHCRVMGIHDKQMLYLDVNALPPVIQENGPVRIDALVRDHSEAGLQVGWPRLFWRVEGELPYNEIAMLAAAGPDSFYANIPAQPHGTTVEYYFQARDNTDREWQRPAGAPTASYATTIELDPVDVTSDGLERPALAISSWPNPFTAVTTVAFRLPEAGSVRVAVYDIEGREICRLADDTFAAGAHTLLWDGATGSGNRVANGVYLIRVETTGRVVSTRVMRLD